ATPGADHFGPGERHRAERAGSGLLQRALQKGLALCPQRSRGLEVRRDLIDPCGRFALVRDFAGEAIPPGNVMGVDQRDRRAPWLTAPLMIEPILELIDDRRVHFGALTGTAVGRGRGPAR